MILGINSDYLMVSSHAAEAYFIILLSLLFFLIGSLLVKNNNRGFSNEISFSYNPGFSLIFILFILSTIGWLFFALQVSVTMGIGNVLTDPNLLNVAIANSSITLWTVPQYLIKISILNSILILYKLFTEKNNRIIYIIMYMIQFVYTFSVRRSTLILFIVVNVIFAAFYYQRRLNYKRIKKILLYFTMIFFASIFLLIYTQKLLNKVSLINGKVFGISIPDGILTIITYFSGNIYSFGYYLENKHNQGFEFLGATFRLPYNFVNDLGLIQFDSSFLDLPFVNMPILFNTTVAQYYIFSEGGYLWICIFYLVFGWISTNVYKKYILNENLSSLIFLTAISSVLFLGIREYSFIFIDIWFLIVFSIFIFVIERKHRT